MGQLHGMDMLLVEENFLQPKQILDIFNVQVSTKDLEIGSNYLRQGADNIRVLDTKRRLRRRMKRISSFPLKRILARNAFLRAT